MADYRPIESRVSPPQPESIIHSGHTGCDIAISNRRDTFDRSYMSLGGIPIFSMPEAESANDARFTNTKEL